MYYLLEPSDPPDALGVRLEKVGWSSNLSWMLGRRFSPIEPIPNPIVMRWDPESSGTYVRDFYKVPIPLMSQRLLSVLQSAGVDNLDTFPVLIRNEVDGTESDSHVAVNIIGVVAAADPVHTRFDANVPTRRISAAIDRLVIDDTAAHGHLLFRLAENVSAIVVHESVADHVKAAEFPSVLFMDAAQFFSA